MVFSGLFERIVCASVPFCLTWSFWFVLFAPIFEKPIWNQHKEGLGEEANAKRPVAEGSKFETK